jgi:hypothetical protein
MINKIKMGATLKKTKNKSNKFKLLYLAIKVLKKKNLIHKIILYLKGLLALKNQERMDMVLKF